jgi:single-strand DNA-binding protein
VLPKVTGEFRVASDPTLRFSPSGMPISEFRVVADKKKKDEASGEWVDDKVCWLTVVVFKKMAENVAESITKGSLVTVTGNLQTESYETKEGEKRQAYKVIADNVGLAITWQPAKFIEAGRAAKAPEDDPFATPAPAAGATPDEPPF